MKKKFLPLMFTVLLFSNYSLHSQSIEWEKNYGGSGEEYAGCLKKTTDGGYIMVGSSTSSDFDIGGNNGSDDYWIIKLDNEGTMIWEKNFGGSEWDVASSVQQTSDGGFVVAGTASSSDGDVSANNGGGDYWIIKLDNAGALQWEKNYGGSGHDRARSIQQTSDGGYILAGLTWSSDGDVGGNFGSADYWVVKLDNSGDLQWEKNLGGSSRDEGNSIVEASDGGYVVVGKSLSSDGDISGNNGMYDYWVVKLDNSGVIQWEKNYGGSNDDNASAVQNTSDGGFVVVGDSWSTDGDIGGNNGIYDYWVVKLDNSGNLQWEKNLGGNEFDKATSVIQTSDDGYVVSGYSESSDGDVGGNNGMSDYWIVKLNNTGNLIWEKNFGGSDRDRSISVQQSSDDWFVLAGYSGSSDGDVGGNNGLNDYWIVKIDSSSTSNLTENNLNTSFNVYPNPTEGNLTIELGETEKQVNIEVTDLNGRVIYQESNLIEDQIELSLDKPAGIYFVNLSSKDEMEVFKVVVK